MSTERGPWEDFSEVGVDTGPWDDFARPGAHRSGPLGRGRRTEAVPENLTTRARKAVQRGVPATDVEDVLVAALRDRSYQVPGRHRPETSTTRAWLIRSLSCRRVPARVLEVAVAAAPSRRR